MNIVFFGSSKYVIPIIEVLRKNFDLKLIITTERNPTDSITYYSIKHKVPYLSTTSLSISNLKSYIINLKSPLAILASFGAIIPEEILNIFPKGIINIHPSLLPKYRGPTPVQTAILNGDNTTGLTIIKLDEQVDHGPILAQVKEPILENDTAESLYERLFKLSASSIVRTIELYLKGKIELRQQNHVKATFTKRLSRVDGYVDISKLKTQNSKLLNRMIRAYHPWPGVWTNIQTTTNKQLLTTKKTSEVSNQKLEVRIKFLPEKKIQVEGKKPMSYNDFINGYPKIGKEILTKLEIN